MTQPLGDIQFTLASRHGQSAREIRQEIRLRQVTLPAGTPGETMVVTCMVAREVGAPNGINLLNGAC